MVTIELEPLKVPADSPLADYNLNAILKPGEKVSRFLEDLKAIKLECDSEGETCVHDDPVTRKEQKLAMRAAFNLAKEYALYLDDVIGKNKLTVLNAIIGKFHCQHVIELEQEEDEHRHDWMALLSEALRESGVTKKGGAKSPLQTPPPEMYYDRKNHCFWVEANDGNWQSITADVAATKLELAGMSAERNGTPSDTERSLMEIRDNKGVDAAMCISGRQPGVKEYNGKKVLVTHGFKLIEPVKGNASFIYRCLNGLLNADDYEKDPKTGKPDFKRPKPDEQRYWQSLRLKLWLKFGYLALRDQIEMPGQMPCFLGTPDCGKSHILQHLLITEVLGGRAADAAPYFTGADKFSGDIFSAEHWVLEDFKPCLNFLDNNDFVTSLKKGIVGEFQSARAMRTERMPCKPISRLSLSLNIDEESLRAMPSLVASFTDKVCLFKCFNFEFPIAFDTPQDRLKFKAQWMAALPAYIYDMLNTGVPKEWRSRRFGVVEWHHPDLIEALDDISRENQFRQLVMTAVFGGTGPEACKALEEGQWEGTAVELQAKILANKHLAPAGREIMNFSYAAGTLLGKCHGKWPGEFIKVARPPYVKDGPKRPQTWCIKHQPTITSHVPTEEE